MMVITRTKTKAEGSVKYECPERNDSLGKETKQPNLQKEERSDKSLRVVVVTKRGWVVNQINQTYFLKGLRMKKSVCLMALLAAFGTSAVQAKADSIIIDFAGEVADRTCEITLRGGGNKLELGQLPIGTEADGKGKLIPVIFKLKDCANAAGQSRTVTLDEDLMTSNPGQTDLVTNMTLSTDHQKVVVQFYTDNQGNTMGLATQQTNTTVNNDIYIEVGHVAMKATEKLEAGDAGTVNAKAMFTVTYK